MPLLTAPAVGSLSESLWKQQALEALDALDQVIVAISNYELHTWHARHDQGRACARGSLMHRSTLLILRLLTRATAGTRLNTELRCSFNGA
jgi:hypothetical protein